MNVSTMAVHSAHGAVAGWLPDDASLPRVRPIEPDDFEREREFVDGLSPRTSYLRLMSPRKPTVEELSRWTRIDPSREGAVVATVTVDGRERQVGVARYVMEGMDGEAEFAIVIGDEWQGMGVGTQLLAALIELARRSGVRQLHGSTLSENRGMLGLAHRFGFAPSREAGAAFVTLLRLALQPDESRVGKGACASSNPSNTSPSSPSRTKGCVRG